MRTARIGVGWAVLSSAILALVHPLSTSAATRTWITTSGTNDWFVNSNWSGSAVPTNGDDVVVTNAGVSILLTNETFSLSSFTISNTATLIFSNWNTKLSATNAWILTNATVTCAGPFTNNMMSNRVWIACTNLLVAAGGKIDVAGKGYDIGAASGADGNGPGAGGGYSSGGGGGAGHGGFGGGGIAYSQVTGTTRGGLPYDSVTNPALPGSAGGWGNQDGGPGGGAVRIDASNGYVTVSGTITANAKKAPYDNGGGGSGGSIWIACRVIHGTNGLVTANGGACGGGAGGGSGKNGNGGGGRVAVAYDVDAQAQVSVPTLAFSVLPGMNSSGPAGDIGTLYFPDSRFLTNSAQPAHSGQWMAPDLNAWSMNTLTISNTWLRFGSAGFQLTVTNQLLIIGSAGRLDIGGSSIVTNAAGGGNRKYFNYCLFSDFTNVLNITCHGSLIITNGGTLGVFAARTNSGTAGYGALVAVDNTLLVGATSTVYACSNPTNGGSVKFQVGSLVLSSTNSTIDANYSGFAGGASSGNSTGYGPGGGGQKAGGSYGGVGGNGGPPAYGSSNAPTQCGSGGGWGNAYDSPGGSGGGLVWVEAASSLTVNGIISANGVDILDWCYYPGGGSGGGIYFYVRGPFTGGANAILRANGGRGDSQTATSVGGGGGRIAVWAVSTNIAAGFTAQANGGAAGSSGYTGTVGSVVWRQIPPAGTVITIR